jgi:hypothetical protein
MKKFTHKPICFKLKPFKTIVRIFLSCLLLVICQAAIPASTDTPYTYTLSPVKTDSPDEYSRMEIENFLCLFAPDYIGPEDTYLSSMDGKYYVKKKENITFQKEQAENSEIRKWFEDHVTVTSRGHVTSLDSQAVQKFFEETNRVIGKNKFVYKPGLPTANIIIEFAPPNPSPTSYIPKYTGGTSREYIGETSILEDNLGILLTMKDTKIRVEKYKTGFGKLISNLKLIKYTPEEIEFKKENRLVKINIINIVNPMTRRTATVHELLHSLGFPGHSPYYESNLFPLPYLDKTRKFSDPVIPPMAAKMIEMLYRPEILPGMTVKEAGEILSSIKIPPGNKTYLASFYWARKKILLSQKEKLLEDAIKSYDVRMSSYIEMDNLYRKQKSLLNRLANIRTANAKSTGVVKRIETTEKLLEKLCVLRSEIIIAENKKQRALKDNTLNKKGYKFMDEEIKVLNELFNTANQIAEVEKKIEITKDKYIETSVRRVIRQLTCIDTALTVRK